MGRQDSHHRSWTVLGLTITQVAASARADRVSAWLGREMSGSMGSLRRSLPPAQAIELRRWTLTAGGELRQMRADLREALCAHRLADHSASPVAERASLVVTELTSNALRHARAPAVVRLLRADGRFTLNVADQDRENLPEPAVAGHTDNGGEGCTSPGRWQGNSAGTPPSRPSTSGPRFPPTRPSIVATAERCAARADHQPSGCRVSGMSSDCRGRGVPRRGR